MAIAERAGKELIANETVWGARDDATHVGVMRYTLAQLTQSTGPSGRERSLHQQPSAPQGASAQRSGTPVSSAATRRNRSCTSTP